MLDRYAKRGHDRVDHKLNPERAKWPKNLMPPPAIPIAATAAIEPHIIIDLGLAGAEIGQAADAVVA